METIGKQTRGFISSRQKARVCLALMFCCLLQCSLNAATNIVSSLADAGPGTLREVLAASAPGDTITFAVEGTISLSRSPGPLVIDKQVNIRGPGQEKLILDGRTQTYIFLVSNNITANISDLTVTNGYNDVFSPEGQGGAIRNLGNLTMTRCLIVDSTSEFGDGGGIYSQGNLTLRHCSVVDNLAVFGGGIADHGPGRLVMDSSAVYLNRAMSPAGSGGGGIFKASGIALLTNVTVSGNRVLEGNGGGIALGTYMLLESCTIVSNRATAFDVNVIIDGKGGGLAITGNGRVEARNTIIAGNIAENFIRANPPLSIGPDVFGFVFSQGWNLIQNTTDSVIAGVLTGNVIGQDPGLAPLQDNGGWTWTHALLTSSPAIDKASPFDFPRTDQRGVARPQDGNGDTQFRADIGAFEKETVIPGAIPGDIVVTSLADDSSPGTLRRAIADAPPGSKITFAVQGILNLTNGQLVIDKNLRIAGPGADQLFIEPRSVPFPPFAANRAFFIASNATASIFDLTILNGSAGTPGLEVVGGGIFNLGNLTLTRCLITKCNAEFGLGGGIASAGPLTLRQCEILENTSGEGGAGIFCDGPFVADGSSINRNRSLDPLNSDGGGLLLGRGIALLTNCTISGNTNFGGSGGGIFARSYLRLESCTVVSNSTAGINNGPNEIDGRGGGVFSTAIFESRNTIFAGNSATTFGIGDQHLGPDCFGTMFSQGWNLIQNPSNCAIAGVLAGNLTGVDPLLGPLLFNGGFAVTHALLPGSPAIDAGSPFTFPPTDERGVSRPQDGNGDGTVRPDIGALEKEPPFPE